MEFVIITGLSGAGKTCALHSLEDIGFYCVDNLPAALLKTFYNLCETSSNKSMSRVAVVIDARGENANSLNSLFDDINVLKSERKPISIIFLDANEGVLVSRFKETRRRHPLADDVPGNTVESALLLERTYMQPFRQVADYIIDTTGVSVKLLKERITQLYLGANEKPIIITFMSFGFKHGAPNDCDTIFDVRCLPNPFYIPELREKTGLDENVRNYVFSSDETEEFLKRLISFLEYSIPLYIKEGKAELVVGIGCTGGKHRSVSIAEYLRNHIRSFNYKTSVYHRDMNKNTTG